MPQYGLKHIYAAPYNLAAGAVSYGAPVKVGDAMAAQIEPEIVEASLYAEDARAEYMRLMVGGTISLGVKYILSAAQTLLLGTRADTHNISYTPSGGSTPTTEEITGQRIGANDAGHYVGIAFYSPDLRDTTKKYFCLFIRKCLFGPPSLNLQTKGRNIQFATPTISGQLMATDEEDQDFYAWALVDGEAQAKAWVEAVFGGSQTGDQTGDEEGDNP